MTDSNMHSRRAGLLILTVAASLMFSSLGVAASPVEPVNKNRGGVAIKGYDPVAYFKSSNPVKGSPQFASEALGATWWFATAGNRDLFRADPGRYAPQFGGYCSWAVSQGYTADVDPAAWRIIDGKLYLNYSKGVQKKWEQDVEKRIEDANRNWPALHK
jgi:hypothetical protein